MAQQVKRTTRQWDQSTGKRENSYLQLELGKLKGVFVSSL